MSKRWRRLSLVVIAICVLPARPLAGAERLAGNLVDVHWLAAHGADSDVLVLDASSAQAYKAKHIPGAVSVDLFSWYGVQETPLADAERVYQSWGISPGKQLVIYDQGGTYSATRLFFSLYHHGFPANDLHLLDGGLSKWQEQGLPVTAEDTPAPGRGSFTITSVKDDVHAKLPEYVTASGDPAANALVEALGPDWHFGEVRAFDRAGHIPHAILLPAKDFFNPDKTFKSPEEIRRMLAYLNIRPEQQVYTHCGGGVAASVPFFALKFLLNYPRVKLFTESEMGWLRDERELPYWTYDAPYLMRGAHWVQSWGGQMMRMYGGARVSIVDVRAAEAYDQGHVPFALNVPADVFKNHVDNPAKLAQLLGAAGVDVSHEAVIVSGAGITPQAALAFLLLEKLRQEKVSMFLDPMSRWTELGFPLKTDATVVAPRASRQDVSVPPTTYPPDVREDVIITGAQRAQGLYPRVFVASGKSVPAMAPDGTIVHVHYADLLNADGTPKPASGIWKILSAAGVPRYAEIVCFSDDPGEAAVNYFVLKLMGYPDIKVLVM